MLIHLSFSKVKHCQTLKGRKGVMGPLLTKPLAKESEIPTRRLAQLMDAAKQTIPDLNCTPQFVASRLQFLRFYYKDLMSSRRRLS